MLIRAIVSSAVALAIGLTAGAVVGSRFERTGWLQRQADMVEQMRVKEQQQADLLAAAIAKAEDNQKEYVNAIDKLRAAERRLSDIERVRDQANRRIAIAAASAESLRRYATGITDLYEACRAEYIVMGLEAAAASAAAHALDKNN